MKSEEFHIIDLTPDNIADYGVCGYKDIEKHVELRKKIEWFKEYYPKGLRIKALITKDGGYQGMLEYIPGKYAHRPVDAEGYMFIHCIFTGFKKEFKGKGYGMALIEVCINDARSLKMSGVAKKYDQGFTVMRSPQCPYTEKNVNAIIDTAKNKFNLAANLIELNDSECAQASPCAFGTFCIIHNGEILSHHPISNTRFENIIKTRCAR